MSVFSVSDIKVSYGKKHVLNGVTLPELNNGEMLGLLGPNAAGKSTLMRALSGEQNYQGKVLLHQALKSTYKHKDWHNRVAYMPQTPPQESSLMPYELMWSAARALSLDYSDQALNSLIHAIFGRLGLAEYAVTSLHSLSGGKRQLVGLALAIIRNPELLLLDEPTSALDLHWRMVVLDYVRERLNQTGGAAIAALHDLDLAARYCDKLVLLNKGKIVASGTPFDVLTRENIAQVYHVDVSVMDSQEGYPLIHIHKPITQIQM